ncbi:ribbon-helix-helix domain-containing protein [Desulfovibrio mangrovi]|uniref:ribbon-helix-helix domain-containing protein n=1 Tax=Desulfovibrio mangrovi TaxID=2976983 RepID=UPI002246E390|nr:ribbon-helix-helix domain-containing protein [Desulfovibrio mangrovi]UZP68872.1 ribbon-helix-helix domain-containing protein [Desulfovibrio mangrovi]
MCEMYASTAPAEYEQTTRSVRLHGGVTSVRLERRFWNVLEELAASEGSSLPKFLETLYDEAVHIHGSVGNFASLLRVVCTTYLASRTSVLSESA